MIAFDMIYFSIQITYDFIQILASSVQKLTFECNIKWVDTTDSHEV